MMHGFFEGLWKFRKDDIGALRGEHSLVASSLRFASWTSSKERVQTLLMLLLPNIGMDLHCLLPPSQLMSAQSSVLRPDKPCAKSIGPPKTAS